MLRGPIGPEDITINPLTGIAFISATDRRAIAAGKPRPGAIWSFDLNAKGATPVNLTPEATTDFQPHGISLWRGPNGRQVLFVVNHAPGADGPRHSVLIFDIIGSNAFMLRIEAKSPLLVMPNDVVGMDPDRFFVTNTHKNPPGLAQQIETFTQRKGAQVLYYDGKDFNVALDDVVMPNGINLSPKELELYVASVTTHSVRVYARDTRNERLMFQREIYLGSGPDNIEVDSDGNLWVAAHPKLLKVGAHAKDPAVLSPSQVFRITPDGAVTDIYADRGEQISAASVAARYGNRLLIGQIFDEGVLDCTMRD
jgi:arylesterase/paraoxonase